MIISHSKKFIFFSFPKTGSESVRDILTPHNEETVTDFRNTSQSQPFYSHMPLAELDLEFQRRGLDIGDYYKFSVTRNPYARLVSIYEMAMSVGKVNKVLRTLSIPKPSFSKWIEATQTSGVGGGGKHHAKWRQYGTWSTEHWTKDAKGEQAMNEVLRLENLSEDLPRAFDAIGIAPPSEIIHKNRRVMTDYREYYDDASKSLVSTRYAYDLQKFGYTF